MPSKNPTIKKAFKDGVISKGQHLQLVLLLGAKEPRNRN